jgi:hypothetical protein
LNFYNNLVLFGVNTSVVVALLEPFVLQPHVEVAKSFSTFYIKANEAISPTKAMPAVNATELAELLWHLSSPLVKETVASASPAHLESAGYPERVTLSASQLTFNTPVK